MNNTLSPVHISMGNGKMEHIPSVNTSSLENEFCKRMSSKEPNSPCAICYSNRYAKFRTNLEVLLKKNRTLLSKRILHEHELPVFNARYVRFSSFGELENDIHMQNLINIAKHNPHTVFGLWTKRANIAMKFPKEPNIKYIYSVYHIDGKLPGEKILTYFDKTFTVVSKDREANCHGRCIDCLLCYRDNDTQHITEHPK